MSAHKCTCLLDFIAFSPVEAQVWRLLHMPWVQLPSCALARPLATPALAPALTTNPPSPPTTCRSTNSSYGRWDEARKMWGLIVNRSRDFVRQVSTCPFQHTQPAGRRHLQMHPLSRSTSPALHATALVLSRTPNPSTLLHAYSR